ncbi:MAG TPA: glycine cleavage system protein GcvH [Candidatus Marinimicrobia bacterium]|jgi:glycine cleavage system H protein|nr:glycine cleavage system protein GcvH [Candidatus Neomarinimicrobiota bacterium]MDP7464732.1 glycine cleavage system protein GcvH [Candidatus Neomarinimicrobiota bacterium]HJM84649.1 glycine cleavage system protein GcvH [Candidatus Neomarinimicrobiota bacterium]|tara:strand:- start:3111 stop:3485 length:375 start_codon:yes stop_codon:yes gene_type:complete
MNIPSDLLYTKDHEWIKIENGIATVGITDYAQGELGDIIFIELPEIGDSVQAEDSIGTIEAVKTVADIYSPMNGEILEVNINLEDNPDSLNTDPYDSGWIIKLNNFTNNDDNYLTPDQYKSLIQ